MFLLQRDHYREPNIIEGKSCSGERLDELAGYGEMEASFMICFPRS